MNDKTKWITKARLVSCGLNTQVALAKAMHVDDSMIRHWSSSKRKPSGEQFKQLSEHLEIEESILRLDYEEVKKEREEKERKKVPDKNKKQILKAIESCHQQEVLRKTQKNKSAVSLQNLIIESLENGEFKKLHYELNQTLLKDIKTANTGKLNAIRIFVSEVAKAAIIVEEKFLESGEKHKLFGYSPVWLIRLLIDSSLDMRSEGQVFNFGTSIKVKGNDFDNNSISHAQLSEKMVGKEDTALYDLVHSLNENLRLDTEPPPSNTEDETAFKIYCRKLNAYFASSNATELHKFCMVKQSFSNNLLADLLKLFDNLRMFEIEASDEKSRHTRVDQFDLGGWLVSQLDSIIQRENQLNNKPIVNQFNDKERDMSTDINVNITNNNPVMTQINNQNNSPQWEHFNQEFKALSKYVQRNIDNPEYRYLINAIQDIKEHIESKGKIPKESTSWLEEASSYISKLDSAWGLTEKTIKAIILLNGTGLV